jgi:hypothetical protein
VSTPAPAKAYLVALTAFALPALGLLVVRTLLPASRPGDAFAAEDLVGPVLDVPVDPNAVSETDRALLRTIADVESRAPQQLALGLGAAPKPKPVEKEVVQPRKPEPDLPTARALTSVMKTSAGLVAVIQGKLYRESDEVVPGWTISAIDDDARTVTIVHTSGEARVLAIEQKAPR